jgi:hypothetical protein
LTWRPLFQALKKSSFTWTDDKQQALDSLKQKITLPSFIEPFILETSASGYGLGDVIMQKGKPISFLAQLLVLKLQECQLDNESLAITEALKKWKQYFATSSLIVRYKE